MGWDCARRHLGHRLCNRTGLPKVTVLHVWRSNNFNCYMEVIRCAKSLSRDS